MSDKTLEEKIFKQGKKSLKYRYLIMIISVLISALVYNFLLMPTHIVTGGIPGIAQINKYLNGTNSSLTIMILSLIMLIISYIYLGKETTKGTVVASLLYPIFVEITKPLTNYYTFDMSDLIVISILIGVVGGIANGLLYKTGFSNGGLPVISQILFKYYNIPIGKTNFIVNLIVILLGSYCFGTTMLLYAFIVISINSKIVDKVLLNISKNKAIYIMTSEKEKVKDFLIKDMQHTATVLTVKDSHKKKNEMILTVVPTREYFQVTESIKVLDPGVFYVVNNAYEVKGGR